jgi:hypothetical protein
MSVDRLGQIEDDDMEAGLEQDDRDDVDERLLGTPAKS